MALTQIPAGATKSNFGNTKWQSTIVTGTTLSAVAGNGYWIDTSSNECTVTLPASASVGDTIELVDYARNWGTNKITINQNSLNFQGFSSPNPEYNTNGQSVTLVYSGATKGWIPTVDDDVTDEVPQSYSVDFLVIAGGGAGGDGNDSGGGGAGGYRNSYNSETSGGNSSSESSLSFTVAQTYTITVGAGASVGSRQNGSNSSISGTGITTITSLGGGRGGTNGVETGGNGGSGGGGDNDGPAPGGNGTSGQGSNGGDGNDGGGGGGGAGAAGSNGSASGGGNGGNGLSSSITGSSVTRGGGGGGGDEAGGGSGGSGGGGAGAAGSGTPGNGTANTGGGGGACDNAASGGAGGSGVVILRMATADYSGTTTGSPTVSTSGSDTILTFTGSGSYTA